MTRIDPTLLRVWSLIGLKGALLTGLAVGLLIGRDPAVAPVALGPIPPDAPRLASAAPLEASSAAAVARLPAEAARERPPVDGPLSLFDDGLTVAAGPRIGPGRAVWDAPYDLDRVKAGLDPAPRLDLDAVPEALAAIEAGPARKEAFLAVTLPLILQANDEVLSARARAADYRARLARGADLPRASRAWLDAQFARYRVEDGDFATLMRRMDIVPPSLALAQAAVESGWGASRFAQEGNALFGQWTWDSEAPGLKPDARPAGMTHRIRAFDTPLDAVRAYLLNLNRHAAYADLRALRAEQRRAGRLNGAALAQGLEGYSEKGAAYVDLVRDVIAGNDLGDFDRVRLDDRGV